MRGHVKRAYAKYRAIIAHLQNHPDGQWTHEIAADLGIPFAVLANVLSWLQRNGCIEQRMLPDRRGRGKPQRYARWYAQPNAPDLKMPPCKSTADYAPHFHPDPDHWGEHERWQARVTAHKVRYNPWARA